VREENRQENLSDDPLGVVPTQELQGQETQQKMPYGQPSLRWGGGGPQLASRSETNSNLDYTGTQHRAKCFDKTKHKIFIAFNSSTSTEHRNFINAKRQILFAVVTPSILVEYVRVALTNLHT
jgi:hypothetical protein